MRGIGGAVIDAVAAVLPSVACEGSGSAPSSCSGRRDELGTNPAHTRDGFGDSVTPGSLTPPVGPQPGGAGIALRACARRVFDAAILTVACDRIPHLLRWSPTGAHSRSVPHGLHGSVRRRRVSRLAPCRALSS